MIVTLIIYFVINAILAVILTLYKSREVLVRNWRKLVIYAVVMLVFGLPIVVFGFLWVWIVGLNSKETRRVLKMDEKCENCEYFETNGHWRWCDLYDMFIEEDGDACDEFVSK